MPENITVENGQVVEKRWLPIGSVLGEDSWTFEELREKLVDEYNAIPGTIETVYDEDNSVVIDYCEPVTDEDELNRYKRRVERQVNKLENELADEREKLEAVNEALNINKDDEDTVPKWADETFVADDGNKYRVIDYREPKEDDSWLLASRNSMGVFQTHVSQNLEKYDGSGPRIITEPVNDDDKFKGFPDEVPERIVTNVSSENSVHGTVEEGEIFEPVAFRKPNQGEPFLSQYRFGIGRTKKVKIAILDMVCERLVLERVNKFPDWVDEDKEYEKGGVTYVPVDYREPEDDERIVLSSNPEMKHQNKVGTHNWETYSHFGSEGKRIIVKPKKDV